MKVFWSWQSDTATNANRSFIKPALDDAIKKVGEELQLDEADRPSLDHDTKNTPGAADIVDTIFRKIENCAVFVADVTPIAKTEGGKAVPNPNVMIELGWAVNKPGWERIIPILNLASGYGPDHLPFDLRKRRVLTYNLKEEATDADKRAAKRKLIGDLASALITNLQNHLDESATATEIVGVPHKVGDPSLWDTAVDPIEHSDAFGGGGKTRAKLIHGPRSYVRIMPGPWSDGPPRVSAIANLPNNFRLDAIYDGSSAGDFGACDEGFVSYWHVRPPRDDEIPSAKNVAIYLDQTGELWFLHGTAFEDRGDAFFCYVDAIVKGWYFALRRSTYILDHLGANKVRKVEVGVYGARDSFWPGRFTVESPRARKNQIKFVEQGRDWNSNKTLAFVTGAAEELWDLFGRPKPPSDHIAAMLGQ